MDHPEDWRYSSARNYLDQTGVLEIDLVELLKQSAALLNHWGSQVQLGNGKEKPGEGKLSNHLLIPEAIMQNRRLFLIA